MKLPILIAMVLYMAMVIWIGVIYSKKTKTSEDYFLGGRGLGPWVTAMSAEASDMSSWLLMGLPGLAYATGFSQAGWTAIGLILGTYLNWKIVAKRLRHYTEVADNAITVPDFFSNRFKDDKKILSSISAIMILIFFTVYTASGFAACGTLFNSVFGLNYQKSMIVCAIVIVLYTSCLLYNLRAHETKANLVCRLLLEKKKKKTKKKKKIHTKITLSRKK